MGKLINLNLYNKYRPNTFSELYGQDHVTKPIESHIKEGNLPHSIILYGPAGVGKTTVGRLIAKALNKSPHGVVEKDSAIDGGKDAVKLLQTDIYNKPFEGDYKTYIFDEAQEITKAAFSSLLKITEEPPPHIKFIFVTTEFDKIPNTIKSRSQCYSFNRIPNSIIRKKLLEIIKSENQNIPDSLLNLIVNSGLGSLRNAIVSLENVMTAYLSGQTEENIANILGVMGNARMDDLILAHLSFSFKSFYERSRLLLPEKTDTLKAIYELEQYIMDCRLSWAMPILKDDMRSDVDGLLTKLESKVDNSSDKKLKSKQLGDRLDSLYDSLVQLEHDLKITSNKEACLNRFVVKVAKTWHD